MAITTNKLQPDKWIDTYADQLFGYAYSKTGKSELAEDLVQETFLAGLKSKDNFKGDSTERTWLFSILKFKIADHYRKASTKREINNSRFMNDDASFMDTFFNEDGGWTNNVLPGSLDNSTEDALENKELGAIMNKCISKLPENYKQLVILKLIEDEKTEIICKELNITTTNYWVLMHRAKLKLRNCIQKNWINQ